MDSKELDILKNPEEFSKIWAKKPSTILSILDSLELDLYDVVSEESKFKESIFGWISLPMIHSENNCRGDDPNFIDPHYWCEKPRVVDPNLHKDFMLRIREEVLRALHPSNLELLHNNVLNCSRADREEYAGLTIVAKDHWVPLSDDRTVLNTVVTNCFIPDSLAAVLIHRHKTPSIRIGIAHHTSSNEILNAIWKSTKSVSIRAAVSQNIAFQLQ